MKPSRVPTTIEVTYSSGRQEEHRYSCRHDAETAATMFVGMATVMAVQTFDTKVKR